MRRFAALLAAVAALGMLVRVLSADHHATVKPAVIEMSDATTRKQGAVEAAASFLDGLSIDTLTDTNARTRFLERWAAPAAKARLLSAYTAEASRVETTYASYPRVSRAAFLGYRAIERTHGRPSITFWAVSVGGAGDAPVAVGWLAITVDLIPTGREWRVVAVRQRPGPSPEMSVAELSAESKSFRVPHVVP